MASLRNLPTLTSRTEKKKLTLSRKFEKRKRVLTFRRMTEQAIPVVAVVHAAEESEGQRVLNGLKDSVREEIRAAIRKEVEAEVRDVTPTIDGEALWAVHELRAIITAPIGSKNLKVFDLIPGLTAGSNPSSKNWVGLNFPENAPASLHGDLSWTIILTRKDGTKCTKDVTTGKLNCGRFFVKTDEHVISWGTPFKDEDFDVLSTFTMEVVFRRNNDKKITEWKTVKKHSSDE